MENTYTGIMVFVINQFMAKKNITYVITVVRVKILKNYNLKLPTQSGKPRIYSCASQESLDNFISIHI